MEWGLAFCWYGSKDAAALVVGFTGKRSYCDVPAYSAVEDHDQSIGSRGHGDLIIDMR